MSSPPTCPICYYAYDEGFIIPKLLSCGNNHSVCEKCLKELLKNRNAKCPLCQTCLVGSDALCFRTNNDIVDSSIYIKHLQDLTCRSRCSTCFLQGDEEMFSICVSCFNDGSLAEIDSKAICLACALRDHEGHQTVTLIEMRAKKTAMTLRASLANYETNIKKISLYISEILPCLTESQKLTNSLADMAEHSRTSQIMKTISETFEKDTKFIKEAIEKFQNEMVNKLLTHLKKKIEMQKADIKKFKTFCIPVMKEVPKQQPQLFSVASPVFLIYGLLKLLFIHLKGSLKKEEAIKIKSV